MFRLFVFTVSIIRYITALAFSSVADAPTVEGLP